MLEGMTQRQERKRNVALRKWRNRGERAFYIGHHISMREHHTLGVAGCSAGVDDGDRISRGGFICFGFKVSGRIGQSGQIPEMQSFVIDRVEIGILVKNNDFLQRWAVYFSRLSKLKVVRDEEELRAAVVQDKCNLRRRERRKHWHPYRAQRERREFRDQPFRSRFRNDGDAVPARQPKSRKSMKYFANSLAEFSEGHVPIWLAMGPLVSQIDAVL